MITRDTSDRSVVSVCTCGARDVAATASASYVWATEHLAVCSIEVDRTRAQEAARSGRARYR